LLLTGFEHRTVRFYNSFPSDPLSQHIFIERGSEGRKDNQADILLFVIFSDFNQTGQILVKQFSIRRQNNRLRRLRVLIHADIHTYIHDRFNRHILANPSFVRRKIRTQETAASQQRTHRVHTHNIHTETQHHHQYHCAVSLMLFLVFCPHQKKRRRIKREGRIQ
jgi:hypothetical protein